MFTSVPPYRRCLALLVLLAPLAGCATLSEGECRTADWFLIGRQDGAHGQERSRLYEHHEACAEYGLRPDAQAYYAGRREGLLRYCTPLNGFREGRDGNHYGGVCPPQLEPAFLVGYRDGRRLHDAAEAVDEIEDEIDDIEDELEDEDLDVEERERLRAELRDLRYAYRERYRELIRLEERLTPPGI